jgi:hypothetical protein
MFHGSVRPERARQTPIVGRGCFGSGLHGAPKVSSGGLIEWQ